jgi:hypothetical protein
MKRFPKDWDAATYYFKKYVDQNTARVKFGDKISCDGINIMYSERYTGLAFLYRHIPTFLPLPFIENIASPQNIEDFCTSTLRRRILPPM